MRGSDVHDVGMRSSEGRESAPFFLIYSIYCFVPTPFTIYLAFPPSLFSQHPFPRYLQYILVSISSFLSLLTTFPHLFFSIIPNLSVIKD